MGKPAIRESFIKCGNIYRVELGGLNNQFLKDLVDAKNPKPDMKTNKLLKDCLEQFENQIRTFAKIDDLSKNLQTLTFSLEFVVQNQLLAVKAFESLNDRGKPLTLMDKTKSYLMFASLRYLNNNDNNLNNKINTTFGNIFTNYDIIKEIGEQEDIDYVRSDRLTEDELLRFFYHYFAHYAIQEYTLPTGYDHDATANDVFEIFLKSSCNQLKNAPDNLKDFIREFLEGLEKFVGSFKNVVEKVKTDCRFKKLFTFLGLNARIYPLIISLETENMLNNSILELIETLDLRVYKIRGTDPRARLYRDVIAQIRGETDIQPIENGIRSFVNYFMPDTLFQHYLNETIYDNRATKFILWEYEKYKNSLFEDYNSELYENFQKEHIFAQNPRPVFPAYGFNDVEEYFANIDRLGNLCLLEETLNKQCQNKLPEQKKGYYQRSRIVITKQLGYEIANNGFNKKHIVQRTKDIIRFCLKRWKI